MTATVIKLPRPSRLECTVCGVTVDAACDCGVLYIPNGAEKRDAATKALKADPNKSDRQIAKAVGVSHPSVAKLRSKLEAAGDVENFTTRTDTKGRKQPSTKPSKPKAKPAPRASGPIQEDCEVDGGDSDEVCWRRGLLYRATNAAGEAAYENWSQFRVDSELVATATRAAEAWNQLAAYLKELHDEQVKTSAA